MQLADVEVLLKETIGLDAASIGSSVLQRAVEGRIAACAAADWSAYWNRLHASRAELQALVDAVVVNETWFFRDSQAFESMVRIVQEEWLPKNPSGLLRLLSLPCSTGEEPFSMTMALVDSGLGMERFQVDGVDISESAITRARGGSYGRNSFRGKSLAHRDRYFTERNGLYQLSDNIRTHARLARGNMFDADFLPGSELFDVIFCRNLLIYFDRSTQDRAIQVLLRLLKSDGVLFVGHSESGLFFDHAFVPVKAPRAFAFHKPGKGRRQKANGAPLPPPSPAAKIAGSTKISGRAPLYPASPPSAPVADASPAIPEISLQAAQYLADQGHLSEAARRCEELIRLQGPSADAFCLLGVIRDAAGKHADAAKFYRKAIYLKPQHRDALAHLSLLLKAHGDVAAAKSIDARIDRLGTDGTP